MTEVKRFSPPAVFKVGDFVTVMQDGLVTPGVVIEIDPKNPLPYRVGGYFKDIDFVWSAWYARYELAHSLD